VGFYGKETQKKARLWLTNGLYDFVCTDAHNVNQLKKLEEIRLSKKELKAWKIVCEKHHQLTNV
jgi:tyrosine-protein phosphatase YwqE